jgi:hypothetical protein
MTRSSRLEPLESDEVPGPLASFLRSVDATVLRLGPRDYIDVLLLVRAQPNWQRNEMGDSLAALLATNEMQLLEVRSLFDRFFPEVAAATGTRPGEWLDPSSLAANGSFETVTTPSPPTSGRYSRNSSLLLVAAVVVLLVGASALPVARQATLRYHTEASRVAPPPEKVAPAPLPSSSMGPSVTSTRRVVYVRPGSYRHPDTADGFLTLAIGLPLLSLGFRWLLLPQAIREARRRFVAKRREQARVERRNFAAEGARKGEPVHLAYHVPVSLPMRDSALEDVAVLLGRVGDDSRGTDLDVDRTLSCSLREGGRLVPIFRRRSLRSELCVLVDREREDGVWLNGVLRTLAHLQRAGVALQTYTFQYVPSVLTPDRSGPPIRLEELSRRYGSARLVIVSRRISECYRPDAQWMSQLDAWPTKAWIDTDPRPIEERRANRKEIQYLVRSGLRRFAWTEKGLAAMARYFAGDADARPMNADWPILPSLDDPRVLAAVERWALYAALVGDPTWDQLEAIRRHSEFQDVRAALPAPYCAQRLLDWVADETRDDPESGDGRTLQLTDRLMDRLIRRFREREAAILLNETLEARARKLLLGQLVSRRPESNLWRLRWELKVVSHRLVLEPERAVELVAPLFGTAVEDEARAMLRPELERQSSRRALAGRPIRRSDLDLLRALTGEVALVAPRDLFFGYWHVSAVAVACATLLLATVALAVRGRQSVAFHDTLFRTQPAVVGVTLPGSFGDPQAAVQSREEKNPGVVP